MINVLKPTHAPELIFGLVAPIGVDLDNVTETLTELLREMEYDAALLRLTTLMKEIPTGLSTSGSTYILSYRERIAYANAICTRLGNEALAGLAISAIRATRADLWEKRSKAEQEAHLCPGKAKEETPLPNQAYIIRQLKRPEEISLLRSVYGKQFILVSAYSSQELRLKRIEELERRSYSGLISVVEAHKSAYELVSQDAKEAQDASGQNVRDAFPLGDVFIDASSRHTCIETLRRFVRLLFGSNEITPTRDEYGMYIAKSASLRSSDLSRQVGAAVFRVSGEVVTMGCNEVPKAGGGTYWSGDAGDKRDFVLGFDPNEDHKVSLLVDLLDRLAKGGHLSTELMSIDDPHAIGQQLLKDTSIAGVKESKVMDLLEFGRIIHAEMSAICDAARKGLSIENGTLYCTTFPCHICAKHIVASGIRRVVYLEPYPKSYATTLHGDAIEVENENPNGRVSFDPFKGVSPHRYRDLFEKGKRKSSGVAQRWNKGHRRPMIDVYYPSYFEAEISIVGPLKEGIEAMIVETHSKTGSVSN
ncbi:MAG TPA: anti-phage dCTP deaminase [Methylocystis sp.]|jgi:cytidine deaminase